MVILARGFGGDTPNRRGFEWRSREEPIFAYSKLPPVITTKYGKFGAFTTFGRSYILSTTQHFN
jgi:hypothetical protein